MFGYDEIFKILVKNFFESFATVITDYEIVKLPKKADILIIEMKEKFQDKLKVFKYFKKYNGIEFKSFADPFKMNEDEYRLGIYINGILLQEKEANRENMTFTLVSSRKPAKLLDTFQGKIEKLDRGIYEIRDIALIPVHLIVIPELPMEFEQEFEILKEVTLGEDRTEFLRGLLKRGSDEITNDLIAYALAMYEEEFEKIFKEEGESMTKIEKNIRRLTEKYGVKKEIFNEGKNEGKIEGKIETAKNMLKDGFSMIQIQKYTGLDIEEIKQLSLNERQKSN